jgi:zinc transporter ZupT
VLATLVAALASLDPSRTKRRFRRALIYYAFAGIALLLGFGFLLVAAFIWAAARWGAFEAALGFGFGFLALAAIIMMVHRVVVARRARRRAEQEKAEQFRSIATAAAVAAVPALVRKAGIVGTLALPLAALAAFAIWQENKPRDRGDLD